MSWLLGRQKVLSGNVTTDLFNHCPVTELIRLKALDVEWLPHLEWFYNSGNSLQKANSTVGEKSQDINIIHHPETLLMVGSPLATWE